MYIKPGQWLEIPGESTTKKDQAAEKSPTGYMNPLGHGPMFSEQLLSKKYENHNC